MSEASKILDDNLRKLSAYAIPNAAVRAFMYNAAGIDQMDNRSFRPDEINQLKEAQANAIGSRGLSQNRFTQVYPSDYNGKVADTVGLKNPVRNLLVNPMRMTVGSAWISPKGDLVNIKNGEAYKGDVYDFNPKVQNNPEYAKYYQYLQDFSTKVRGDKPPMTINLNVRGN